MDNETETTEQEPIAAQKLEVHMCSVEPQIVAEMQRALDVKWQIVKAGTKFVLVCTLIVPFEEEKKVITLT